MFYQAGILHCPTDFRPQDYRCVSEPATTIIVCTQVNRHVQESLLSQLQKLLFQQIICFVSVVRLNEI